MKLTSEEYGKIWVVADKVTMLVPHRDLGGDLDGTLIALGTDHHCVVVEPLEVVLQALQQERK